MLYLKQEQINLLTNYQKSKLLKIKLKLLEKEVEKATENLLKREHETLTILGSKRLNTHKDPWTASYVARVCY